MRKLIKTLEKKLTLYMNREYSMGTAYDIAELFGNEIIDGMNNSRILAVLADEPILISKQLTALHNDPDFRRKVREDGLWKQTGLLMEQIRTLIWWILVDYGEDYLTRKYGI